MAPAGQRTGLAIPGCLGVLTGAGRKLSEEKSPPGDYRIKYQWGPGSKCYLLQEALGQQRFMAHPGPRTDPSCPPSPPPPGHKGSFISPLLTSPTGVLGAEEGAVAATGSQDGRGTWRDPGRSYLTSLSLSR